MCPCVDISPNTVPRSLRHLRCLCCARMALPVVTCASFSSVKRHDRAAHTAEELLHAIAVDSRSYQEPAGSLADDVRQTWRT